MVLGHDTRPSCATTAKRRNARVSFFPRRNASAIRRNASTIFHPPQAPLLRYSLSRSTDLMLCYGESRRIRSSAALSEALPCGRQSCFVYDPTDGKPTLPRLCAAEACLPQSGPLLDARPRKYLRRQSAPHANESASAVLLRPHPVSFPPPSFERSKPNVFFPPPRSGGVVGLRKRLPASRLFRGINPLSPSSRPIDSRCPPSTAGFQAHYHSMVSRISLTLRTV